MTVENPLSLQEQIKTPERSVEELYFDALEKKRDTLLAFRTMNSFRKGKTPERMTSEEIGQYKVLREDWRSKKEISFSVFESLPENKQEELTTIGSRLYDVQAELTLLKQSKTLETATQDQNNQQPPFTESGIGIAKTETSEQPENALTLADVENKIARLEKSQLVLLLELEAWKAKRAELQEQQDAEASPDRTPPKGFMQRVKDGFIGSLDEIGRTLERSLPIKIRYEELPEAQSGTAQRQPEAEPEKSEAEEISEKPASAKKDAFWTLGFWKERAKGLITPFGFLEFYRAEKFRRRTGEIINDTEALAILIKGEKNLSLEEAQAEAQEIVDTLKEQKLTISAPEFYDVSKNITDRKRKENDEDVARIVKSAEDDIYDKLQKSGHKGEAGQELLTRENQLAIRSELVGVLNKLRDGAVRIDQKEFARLIRRNLDEKWNWRYVWGGIDAVLWFAGIAAISMKFLASKEAVAVGAKVAAGGAGSVEAAREFVETGMHKDIWSTLEQMAKNGPGHFTPTGEQLKEWSQGVLDSIRHYEPEWVNNAVEGLKSSRTMPEGFPLKVPAWVMKAMGYPGF